MIVEEQDVEVTTKQMVVNNFWIKVILTVFGMVALPIVTAAYGYGVVNARITNNTSSIEKMEPTVNSIDVLTLRLDHIEASLGRIEKKLN
jgi:hypothetical protein